MAALPGATGFVLVAGAWSLTLFGALKLALVERMVLWPLVGLQRDLAAQIAGPARAPIAVTLACSGAEVIALCLAVTLAYPVPWRWRLLGATGGIGLLFTLNTLRIGTLGWMAGTAQFTPWHLYIWPGVLIVATLGYVGAWMAWAQAAWPVGVRGRAALGRFAALAAGLVGLFVALAPWMHAHGALAVVAAGTARAAAALLKTAGVEAAVAANVLMTRQGGFRVTPECITTPLMPVYLAAALTLPRTWARRAGALLAFGPLFATLALARLLTVALPPLLLASPLVLTHAFYQLLVGGIAIGLAAWWRGHNAESGGSVRRAILAAAAALAVVVGGGGAYTRGLAGLLQGLGVALPTDPQGAWSLLPAYQLGLLLALWLAAFGVTAGRRLGLGLTGLAASQVVLLVVASRLSADLGLALPVTLVRAWAVAGPLLVVWGLARRGGVGADVWRAGPAVGHG